MRINKGSSSVGSKDRGILILGMKRGKVGRVLRFLISEFWVGDQGRGSGRIRGWVRRQEGLICDCYVGV